MADGGTVFLDEVGDLDRGVQPKLLKVLDETRFRRVGDVRDRRVDIRLIAATHRDLDELVARDEFRSDLYFRIRAVPLQVPPLRERQEDIPILARSLVRQLASELGRTPSGLSAAAETRLREHPWPGNIRELRNVLERALLLSGTNELDADDLDLRAPGRREVAREGAPRTLAEVERQAIERALAEASGHVGRAAEALGIRSSTLYYKLRNGPKP